MTQITDEPVSTFGQRLQHCRKAQKIGAEKLADMVNAEYGENTTTRSVITAIETGRKLAGVTLAEVLRLAHVLGVSPLCLIIDLEQPFLRADFPGFEGLDNLGAMRRISGGAVMGDTVAIPAFMEKGQRIGLAVDTVLRNSSAITRTVLRLKELAASAATKDGRGLAFKSEDNTDEYDTERYVVHGLYERCIEQRERLITDGVIIPTIGTGYSIYFTEQRMKELATMIAPYAPEPMPELVSESPWGDAL